MSDSNVFGDSRYLSWSIEIPDRYRASFNGRRPQALLVLWNENTEEERIRIPIAVARALRSKSVTGELSAYSREELLYHMHLQELACAHTRLGRLLERRDYSSVELRRKFVEDGYQTAVIDEIVERALSAHLISDTRYADVFIRSKINMGWGMNKIVCELSRRGIDVDELDGWPYDYLNPEDELARAIDLAERKSISGVNVQQKLVRYLISRGFSSGVAHRAVREAYDWDAIG